MRDKSSAKLPAYMRLAVERYTMLQNVTLFQGVEIAGINYYKSFYIM